MKVFINGKFYNERDAKISVFDHGFLYGDGLFETMRVYDGNVFLIKEHLQRLYESSAFLKLDIPWKAGFLYDSVYRTLHLNKLRNAYVRLAVTRGTGKLGINPDSCIKPNLVIITKEYAGYPEELYNKGVIINIGRIRKIHPLCLMPQVKSMNFLNSILARLEERGSAYFETVLLNLNGYVTEGTVTNIFIVKKKTLITPSINSGILPGITRQKILELAGKRSKRIEEKFIIPRDLFDAEECFLTSSLMEIMPVKEIAMPFGKTGIRNKLFRDCPGEITLLLSKCYKHSVEKPSQE